MTQKAIILFDGACSLCNKLAQFTIKRDKNNCYQLASIQSETAKKLAAKHQIDFTKTDSIILIIDDSIFIKSVAVFKILENLNTGWKIVLVLKIIPKFIRNLLYDLIAKNRRLLFGKQNECIIQNSEIKNRFLD